MFSRKVEKTEKPPPSSNIHIFWGHVFGLIIRNQIFANIIFIRELMNDDDGGRRGGEVFSSIFLTSKTTTALVYRDGVRWVVYIYIYNIIGCAMGGGGEGKSTKKTNRW